MGIRAKTMLKGAFAARTCCTHLRQTPRTCILRYQQTLQLQGLH